MSESSAPAKKTATKKTAAKSGAPKAPKQQVVPAIPEGWTVDITFSGPNGEIAKIDETKAIVFVSPDGTKRRAKADTLADALRSAGAGIKALHKVSEQERKAKEAQEAALSVLGEVDDSDSTGEGSNGPGHDVVPDPDDAPSGATETD